MDDYDFKILDDGLDIEFKCRYAHEPITVTLDYCEEHCDSQSTCSIVAEMNDNLVEYERGNLH